MATAPRATRFDDRAAARRHRLVDHLVATGACRSAPVEAALRTVPRHLFVADPTDLDGAYDDRAQLLKSGAGATLSTISQPSMIAIMLELAALSPGDRVLEIGTGSGYNAALLSELVGPGGGVVTVDVEIDLVVRARRLLVRTGHDVAVIAADGRLGWPRGGPYQAIVVTAAVAEVDPSWRAQLAPGGRVLVPLHSPAQVVVEERHGDGYDVVATTPASFIPLRPA